MGDIKQFKCCLSCSPPLERPNTAAWPHAHTNTHILQTRTKIYIERNVYIYIYKGLLCPVRQTASLKTQNTHCQLIEAAWFHCGHCCSADNVDVCVLCVYLCALF